MLPSLRIWLDHFEYHAPVRHLPDAVSDVLTNEEHRAIGRSIATFQLGEQSSGSSLLNAAYRFAQERRAPEVARITELLIREEQQHAVLLGQFMAAHAIPLKSRHWCDGVFRRVRRMGGLELSFSVLLTAEIIGTVYYRALEQATGCQRLRWLCRKMVADELAHVGFESDLLQGLRASRAAGTRLALSLAHQAFFTAVSLVVWLDHRAVLRCAGFRMASFMRACRDQYAFYLLPPRLPAADTRSLE